MAPPQAPRDPSTTIPPPTIRTYAPTFTLPVDEPQAPPSATGAARATVPPPVAETVQPLTGTGPAPAVQNPQAPPATTPQLPFGSQLFIAQPQLFGPTAINRHYIIGPGDQIAIRVWGAFAYNGVQGVDPEGNIFVPQVGPIHVEGVTSGALQAKVADAVKRVFTQNVDVYASLLSKQPIAVYVTGAVNKPGWYSGDRMDSPLQYLAQAGGIDPKSGSYRDVRIIRSGRTLAHIDLYAFLTGTELPPIEFRNNDTIFVGFQRPTVTATGDVQNSYRFELNPATATGARLIALARPNATVSDVSVQGLRDGRPYDAYLPLSQFRRLRLAAGDVCQFTSDYVSDTIFVNVSGQSQGPSSLVVPRGARLGDVLKLIQVDPRVADLNAIYLRRQSVAVQQQAALNEALSQLARSVLTYLSVSSSDAAINNQEAQLVQSFIHQAAAFKPQGTVVLANSPDRDDVLLEPYDQIVIPPRSNVVLVTGEVRLPQTLVYTPDRPLSAYVNLAGGFTDRANTSRFVVLHESGEVQIGGDEMIIRPGDQIMVMPVIPTHNVAVAQDITHLIYQLVVSTGIVFRLTGLIK